MNLSNLARSGVYLHISNREKSRSASMIGLLAKDCQAGGGWCIYYHHGPIPPEFKELGEARLWMHVSDRSVQEPEGQTLLMEILRMPASRLGCVLYLEKGLDEGFLKEFLDFGGFVFFTKRHYDYRSPFYPLEKRAERKKLDFRAYYLYPGILQ